MALFDKDNPGKNLANATIWLDAAHDAKSSNDADSPGCLKTLVIFVVIMVVAILALGSIVGLVIGLIGPRS